jgi:hypothetical protein
VSGRVLWWGSAPLDIPAEVGPVEAVCAPLERQGPTPPADAVPAWVTPLGEEDGGGALASAPPGAAGWWVVWVLERGGGA